MKKRDASMIFAAGVLAAVFVHAVAGAAVDTLSVLAGPKGAVGATGNTGPQGDIGDRGPPGVPEYSGNNGITVNAGDFTIGLTNGFIASPQITTVWVADGTDQSYIGAKGMILPIYERSGVGNEPTLNAPVTTMCVGSDRAIAGGCVIQGANCYVTQSSMTANRQGWTCDAPRLASCIATTVVICLKTPT